MKVLITKIGKDKFCLLIDQAVFSGSSFLITLFIARTFQAEALGYFASVVLVAHLAVNILSALNIQVFQVMQARFNYRREYDTFILALQLILTTLLYLLAVGLIHLPFEVLSLYRENIYIITFFITVFSFHDFLRKTFIAKSDFAGAAQLDFMSSAFQWIMLGIVMLNSYYNLNTVLLYLSIGYIPGIIMGMVMWPKVNFNYLRSILYAKTHWKEGKWLLFTGFTQWWSGNLFVVASGLYLGLQSLGALRLVQSLFGVLNILLTAFENYALPKTAIALRESSTQAKVFLRKVSLQSFVVFAGILISLFIFSDHVIILIGGSQYAAYGFLVKAMAVLYLIIFSGYPVRIAIRALVLNKSIFIAYAITLVVSLLSFRFLLEEFNLLGAVAGLFISQIIVIAYWQIILSQQKFSLWK